MEIDTERTLWTIPAARMKGGRDHQVPLSPRALEIINVTFMIGDRNEHIFPGQSRVVPSPQWRWRW
jgi:integrase